MNDLLSLQSWLTQLAELSAPALMLWKVSILFAVVWLGHVLLLRSNPRWPVLLWRGAAVGVLLIPVLAWTIPAIELASSQPMIELIDVPLLNDESDSTDDDKQLPDKVVDSSAQLEVAVHPVDRSSASPSSSGWGLRAILVSVWTAGLVFFFLRTVVGLRHIHARITQAKPASPEVVAVFERVVRELNVERPVDLRVSTSIRSPILCGHWRPTLLIPDQMLKTSRRTQLPGVFAHELAHVRSHDLSWNLLLHVVSSALWFHPLVWFSRARHEAACESVSDAVAARYVGDVKVYSQTLARVALDALAPPMFSVGMARTSDIRRRVGALERKIFDRDLRRRLVAVALAVGFLFTASLGGLRVVYAEVSIDDLRLAAEAREAGDLVDEKKADNQKTKKSNNKKANNKRATKKAGNAKKDGTKEKKTSLTEEASGAANRGLAYLAAKQKADGSFGVEQKGNELAVTALAGQAFLSSGSKPGEGKYGAQTKKAVDYIVKHVTDSGLIASGKSGSMYVHAYGVRFLADAHLASPTPATRVALVKSVALIVNSQNALDGWRYSPASLDADSSVSSCQLLALQAARRAGIEVPDNTIKRAVGYLMKCHRADGGFSYTAGPGPGSGIPRSAAATGALYLSNFKDKEALAKSQAYLNDNGNMKLEKDPFFFYTQYHLSTAMRYAGKKHFQRWYKVAQADIIEMQSKDGSWASSFGVEYATAKSCIVLLSPTQPIIRMAKK